MLEGSPQLRAIDEEAKHAIVPRRRFGKANGAPDQPLAPGPQLEVVARDCLRVLLAHLMRLWVAVPLVRAPPRWQTA